MSVLLDSVPLAKVEPRWLWLLRALTLTILLLVLVPLVLMIQDSVPGVYAFLPAFFAYGLIQWGLRENPPSKSALALAVGMGTILFSIPVVLVLFSLGNLATTQASLFHALGGEWVVLALLQVMMFGTSLAARQKLIGHQDPAPLLRAARVSALASLALVGRRLYEFAQVTTLYGIPPNRTEVLILLGTALLYAALFWAWRLRASQDPVGTAKSLVLAMVVSPAVLAFVLWLAIFPFGLDSPSDRYTLLVICSIGAYGLLTGGYAATAIRIYYLQRSEAGDRGKLFTGFLSAIVICLFSLWSLAGLAIREHHPGASNDASAILSLRTIHSAEETYANSYHSGYSGGLKALGPPPEGSKPTASAAEMIDAVLSSGKKNGFTFTYSPGSPGAGAHISTYTISARPIEFGRTGIRSFFTDETGVIRFTPEDRAATVKDIPIS